MEDVELDIREDALSEIAKKAIERKTGARGLRSILESILMETMYKVPSEESLDVPAENELLERAIIISKV